MKTMVYDFHNTRIMPRESVVSTREDVTLLTGWTHLPLKITGTVPVIVAGMTTTGTMLMAKEACRMGAMVALHKHYSTDELVNFMKGNSDIRERVFITIGGSSSADIDKAVSVCDSLGYPVNVSLDVANGHTYMFQGLVREAKERLSGCNIMAGTVGETGSALGLIEAGADIIRVGIGGGLACTTQNKTGVGAPALSLVMEIREMLSKARPTCNQLICLDGGVRHPGDIAKALVAGADMVMCGGLFAGTDECHGEFIEHKGEECFVFYGMASKEAQEKFSGGVKDYATAEGRSLLIPHKGPVKFVLRDIFGGLRSTCAYCNALTIKDLSKAELVYVGP